jgi:anti-sigma factor RsiW
LNCHELNTLLHGYLDGELDLVHNLEIEGHLGQCSACAAGLRQEQHLREALRDPTLYHRAGSRLRERILSALPQRAATSPLPRRSRRIPALAAALATAACLAFLALLTWEIVRSNRGDDFLVREVVAGHVRSMMDKHPVVDVKSSDTHTVKPWFHGKVDYAPPVRDLTDQDFPLSGGRLDYLDNQKVAALVYKRHKHVINVFVWPQADGRAEATQELTRQGYNLIHWTRDGFTYWAISDLNLQDLREFAALLQR